jgi:hypothetical protein
MIKTIEISQDTFERLEEQVIGFSDTPDSVISRLLDGLENKTDKKPELIFLPEDEEQFKKLLIRDQIAEITLYKKDGSRIVLVWNAKRFSESSNLRANLWSGQLRDWKSKEIVKAELRIYCQPTNNDNKSEFQICRVISPIFNIPFDELLAMDFDFQVEGHSHDAKLKINFHDTCTENQLKDIPGINLHDKSVIVRQHEIDYPLS